MLRALAQGLAHWGGGGSLIIGTSTQPSLMAFPSPSPLQDPQMISGSFVPSLALMSVSLKFLLYIPILNSECVL